MLAAARILTAADGGWVQIIGHRGARGLFPENTLAGIAGAWAIGVDAVEIDVRLTADGVIVLHHDPVLTGDRVRGAGGAWLPAGGPAIAALTWPALTQYDIGRARPGSRLAWRFRDQVPVDGARVPRLDEVLALRPRPRLLIEVKPVPDPLPIVAALGALLPRAADAIVESFDWRVLRLMRGHWPSVKLAFLTKAVDAADAPERVVDEGGRMWCPSVVTLTRGLLIRAQAAGLCVVPWTVNAERAMRRLILWGADGLITDYPDRARRILREEGGRVAVAVALT